MSVLTKYSNDSCPKADTCYRVIAKPMGQQQHIQYFNYRVNDDGVACGFYYPVKRVNLVGASD